MHYVRVCVGVDVYVRLRVHIWAATNMLIQFKPQ